MNSAGNYILYMYDLPIVNAFDSPIGGCITALMKRKLNRPGYMTSEESARCTQSRKGREQRRKNAVLNMREADK